MGDLTINAEKLLRIQDGDVERQCRHYGLTAAMLDEGLEHLREWYKLQPHLPQGQLNDRKLIRHFSAYGFSLEKTKKNLDSYYSARHLVPEFCSNRDPCSKEVENVFKYCVIATFPQRTDTNYRVTFLNIRTPDVSVFNLVESFKVCFMIGEYRLMNETAVGEHYIIHFENAKLGHILQVTPSFVTKALFYLQSCMGGKIKGIHLVGLPPYAETAINMFKRALSKKIVDRFYTYSCNEELKNVFPSKMLPKDLGGEDISTIEIMDNWKATLQLPQWRQWFLEQENIKSDESKRDRSNENDSAGEFLGIHGSFRKLEVD